MIPDNIRPLVSRVLAPFVAALVLWAGNLLGLRLDGVDQALTDLLTLAVFAAITGTAKNLADRKLNPTNVAKLPPSAAARAEARADGGAS